MGYGLIFDFLKNARIRTIGLVLSIFMVTVGVLTVTVFPVVVNDHRQITDEWIIFEGEVAEKQRLLSALRGAIGYGGFIHQFKNFILRGDEKLYTPTMDNLRLTRRILVDYAGLKTNGKERSALADLSGTMAEYSHAASLAKKMVANGLAPASIDDTVIIDDSNALKALGVLQFELSESYRTSSSRLYGSTVDVSRELTYAAFAIGILVLMLIFLFFWFIQSVIRKPMSALENAMTSLSVGDAESEIPFKELPNEIGDMARTVEIFRENFLTLRKTEDTLTSNLREVEFQRKALDQHAIVSIADVKGNITYCNDKFCDISGYTLEELIGNNHRMLKSKEHPREFFVDLWRTIASGQIWHGEIKNIAKNGTPYWVTATIVPFLDEKGKPNQYVALRTDITEQKEHEAVLSASHNALLEAKVAAEKANHAKSEFLSSMSHELRTPLNAILGFAQVLEWGKKNPLDERQKEQIHHIMKGGDHLLKLIDEVLDLAKIEAGFLTLSMEPVETKPLLDECLVVAGSLAAGREIIIQDRTAQTLPALWTDHLRCKQAILNLLSNAVKYNRTGGTIWVDAEERDGRILRVSITDTGDGIAEDRQSELFQPFSRLGAEATETEGTGIGLALTHQLVEEMKGEISFSSTLGEGSTFWIDFPLADDDYVHETTASLNTVASKVAKKTFPDGERLLLYVEDNPANLALMIDIVEDIPRLSLISAHTAELGLAMAADRKPDVIILDINLPGMNGIEAVQKLKEREATQNIPVLALSANAMPKTIEKGIQAGFRKYLTKPVNIVELLDALSDALGEQV